ncbi:MAG: MMPL family transporter [Chthoniobacterales bacterium]
MRKIFIVLLAVVATAVVITGLSRISLNIDILKLLPPSLKQTAGLSLFLNNFSQSNELLITVEADDPDKAEENATSLAELLRTHPALIKRVTDAPLWEKKPAELTELLAYFLLNQPHEKIHTLVENLSPEKAPAVAKATFSRLNRSVSMQEGQFLSCDPYGLTKPLLSAGLFSSGMQSEFASGDGKLRVLYVEAAPALRNYKETILWIKEIRQIVAAWSIGKNVVTGFTGEPAFIAEISSAMEWDMKSSGVVTIFVIALIFWLCYRKEKPLLYLVAMLLIVFTISLAIAGLVLKNLTVIGVGFSSIMIGLSVDYGYLIYQKSLRHNGSVRELQWNCLQNILWTAGTTAAAFFTLNMSSLPGLSQLGNLVGIGVLVGATVMLTIFAPLCMRWRRNEAQPPESGWIEQLFDSQKFRKIGVGITLLIVAILLAELVTKGLPDFDVSVRPLRPRTSEAYDTLDKIYAKLTNDEAFLSLVVTGATEEEVHTRLEEAEQKLTQGVVSGEVKMFRTPLTLWPSASHQKENIGELAALTNSAPRLKQTLIDSGFTDKAFEVTGSAFNYWKTWSQNSLPIWPQNETSRWILRRLASHKDGHFVAMGMVEPVKGHEDALTAQVEGEGIYLTSWDQLGRELKRVIPTEFTHLIIGLVVVLVFLLLIGFRSLLDVSLLAATMGLVFLSLLGAMRLLDIQWNLFNLAAVLLLLGTGIDYSILLVLDLRRSGGDISHTYRALGTVITLCSTSAAVGFGTLSWANNHGLSSLGETCAVGLLLDGLISLFLLPPLWRFMHRGRFSLEQLP